MLRLEQAQTHVTRYSRARLTSRVRLAVVPQGSEIEVPAVIELLDGRHGVGMDRRTDELAPAGRPPRETGLPQKSCNTERQDSAGWVQLSSRPTAKVIAASFTLSLF